MNKKFLTAIVLWMCCTSVLGQVAIPDTIYVYETVTVYDTIRISDTIRIGKQPETTTMQSSEKSSAFVAPPTATFSKNDIILHENKKQKDVKTMKLKTASILSAIITTTQGMAGLSAQETTTADNLKSFPAQLSIFYPMTTQGDQTVNYHYNLSFNLFSGKVGAVTGIEFGTLSNRVEHEMKGVQFSGLINITQSVTGVQFGGLINASKTVNGLQYAGWGNISGNTSGVQVGEIANIAESVKGVQFGGIVNVTRNITGLQFGGIANLCERNKGIQIAGITNVTDESRGFQFAGVTNVSGKVSGASFGGLFNRTGTLHGFQFGIVNVTDTIEAGFSMAIINIVKKGFYNEWALTFADYLNVGLSYKMGTQKFYTIFTAGANFMEDQLWVAGFGFGNRTSLGRRVDFQPEIVAYSYYPNDFKNIQTTWSNHLKLGFVFKLNDNLGITVAPSIYQLNYDLKDGGEAYKISPIKEFYSHLNDNYLETMGVGISIGLVLK